MAATSEGDSQRPAGIVSRRRSSHGDFWATMRAKEMFWATEKVSSNPSSFRSEGTYPTLALVMDSAFQRWSTFPLYSS